MWTAALVTFKWTAALAALPRIQVDRVSRNFVDAKGNTRVFHGVNAVEKLHPYLPEATGFSIQRSLSAHDAANLSSWGLNVVRLGVLWAGVMPQPGQVNQTYLDSALRIVRTLAEFGVYTLIDMHQDSMGARFCGEGFPDWAVRKALQKSGFNSSSTSSRFPAPFRWDMKIDPATGWPSRQACASHDFSNYYVAEEATAARVAFFASPELHADFAEHWAAVAKAFKGESAVLGYELINEPWNNAPWASDAKELLPLYSALHQSIRQHDEDAIVFYEPHVLNGQLGVPSDFPAGGPGGEKFNDRQAFAYHIYCQNETESAPALLVCDAALRIGWSSMTRSAHIGGGRMLTEFGAVSDSSHAVDVLKMSLSHADAHMASWAYWSFKALDDSSHAGALNPVGSMCMLPAPLRRCATALLLSA